MSDYVLEGVKWGGTTFGTAGGTVTWAADGSVPTSFIAQISAAFADWARYANINFSQVSSTSTAQIDFSDAPIDGLNNILGQTSYSYAGASLRSAQITFDSGEGWHLSGGSLLSSAGANFFIVALHEIGHAIGMDHYNVSPAVMNAYLNLSVTDLTQSDIDGIRAVYGSAATSNTPTPFGSFIHDPSSAGGVVYAFYEAFLGRAPDPLGFEDLTHDLLSGMSLRSLAQAMLSSAEHTRNFGAYDHLSNEAFVEQLYQVIQHRSPDAPGLAHWEDALAGGESRVDVGIAFALSAEHIGSLQGAYTAGVFDPDKGVADIARLYWGIHGRAPDGGGLYHFVQDLANGKSVHDVARDFIASPEYQSKFGGLDDVHFVDTLYQNALGRHAESEGLSHFVAELRHGGTRADVAFEIVESTEAHQHLASLIETGWVLA